MKIDETKQEASVYVEPTLVFEGDLSSVTKDLDAAFS